MSKLLKSYHHCPVFLYSQLLDMILPFLGFIQVFYATFFKIALMKSTAVSDALLRDWGQKERSAP